MPDNMLHWSFSGFESLTLDEFYQLLKLRIDVFVVEQECAYPELDVHDKQPLTVHLRGINPVEAGELVACARLIPVVEKVQRSEDLLKSIKVGRVAVAEKFRSKGVAKELMLQVFGYVDQHYPGLPLELSAQTYVIGFYQNLGFKVESGEYLEDGIPHVDMVLAR